MIDSDLAELYGISTGRLNEQVRRNHERFPSDFMFELTPEETRCLKSQFVTSKPSVSLIFQSGISKEEGLISQFAISKGRGGRRKPLFAFTQEGVAMLSSVLRSPRAVQVNIAIMRAFVRLHEILSTHKELSKRLNELEKKYDDRFRIVFEAIRNMMQHPEPPQNKIGF
ncbi:MAG: ORF6N domain-containing protein [Patescibacteria group bacterium]